MNDRALLGRDAISLVCRLGVAAVFLYASLDKIVHPDLFAQSIANYRMVPMALLHPFAWLLPVAEVVVAVALVVGWQGRGASLLAVLMTVMFIGAIATALIRGLDISCGCFETEGGGKVGRDLLIRDIFLLIGAAIPLWLGSGRWSIDHLCSRRRVAGATLQNT